MTKEMENAMEDLARVLDRLCDVTDDSEVKAYTDEDGSMVFKPQKREV